MKIFRLLKEDYSDEAEERRIDKEWEGTNIPHEGLLAHALFKHLVENRDLTPMSEEESKSLVELEKKLGDLQARLAVMEKEGEDTEEIESDIETIQEEISELNDRDDVYKIVPTGDFYDMTEFEVINAGLDGYRYAVGDANDTQTSAEERVDQLINDIGYEGFNSGFAKSYLDTDKIVDYAREVYQDDVQDNPDVYLDEEDRMLSSEQEEKISVINYKISKIEENVENLEEKLGDEYDEDINERIDQLTDIIEEYKGEIQDIQNDPEGDWPQDLIDEKVEQMLRRVERDPEDFLNEMGLDYENFIDRDELIEGVIDTDGLGHTLNSYDGTIDEVYVNDILFYVMRID